MHANHFVMSNQEQTHSPSDLVMNQMILCFKTYKESRFGEKGKKCHNVFRTGAKMHFSKKKYLGVIL